MKSKAWTEKFMQGVFLIAACTSVLAVALICIFLFANGVPAIREIGFVKFITGELWRPNNNLFGIFPMIIGSLYVTAGAIVFGVPIGILTSVFMAMYCPKKIYRPLKAATELLAGIPSVVYGFFGLVVLVPMVREFGRTLKQMGIVEKAGDGKGLLTTSIILGMMILPTIIGTTESAIRAVPTHYYEGALALGATHERSIFTVVIPAAKSGVLAGNRAGNRTCDRRDHGSYHDRGKSAENCTKYPAGNAYADRKYRTGDGICDRSAQGSADRDRCSIICVHPDHQLQCGNAEKEDRT